MEKQHKLHFVRVDDITAETLEREASRMPPSYKEQADILRKEARILRGSTNSKTVPIFEEVS